jgi:CRP-like cAMP-binding protein
MVTSFTAPHDRQSVDRFGRGVVLNDQERAAVEACVARATSLDAGREIAPPGAPLHGAKYILSGWVGQARLLDDGRRQIVDLNVAGELTAFDLRPNAMAKGAYICLSPVRMADAGDLLEKAMTQPMRFPGLAALFQTAEDDAHSRLIDQILRVGRMLAHERVAHFALDLYRRFDRVGLCFAQSFPMPLTQEVLGDVLGLSTVHINRTLQQLRHDRLLRTTSGRWEILDMAQMVEVASGARAPGRHLRIAAE